MVRVDDLFEITCDGPPHPPDPGIELRVGIVTGLPREWPRALSTLPLGPIAFAEQTGLVSISLHLEGREIAWLHHCAVEPSLGEARDRAALAAYLGPAAFLTWLRSLLGAQPVDIREAERWDDPKHSATSCGAGGADLLSELTVEEIMASWARDPEAFRRADQRIGEFLDEVVRRALPEDAMVVARLRGVSDLWSVLRAEFLEVH